MKTVDQKPIKIIIADDHPLFRRGLKHALEETDDIEVACEADNGDELLSLIKGDEFDMVLLDIAMPGKSGLDLLKQLKSEYPKLPILVLSVYPEEQYAVRFIKAGASGYLTKESASEKLVEAIRKVADGGKYASQTITEKLAFDFSDYEKPLHERLSDREYQVFGMISVGKSLTEIGKELSLSVKTISTHRTRILEKMKMKKNAELIHYAITQNLI
ncbi:MAG TPA: response regulator transcription factor [Nitrospinaceae bacterium]|jgi:DNA-binding NarL/FixJ family response regulator|nr:response regulator transcription factor [Nitrospinaceae bacterium]MDP7108483.1 response regulator transcription factor [Nitrospinaceae bacterium]HJL73511.1 response regulator transcription factor [Nitrospinaceae bacterium]HJO01130.1 response regulator transcription factor [Nitrospinaceae bacterium]|tara:strand:+ start:4758 stop:5405 length:648 start_codon:yes stop_codon:yes gene_type:complete